MYTYACIYIYILKQYRYVFHESARVFCCLCCYCCVYVFVCVFVFVVVCCLCVLFVLFMKAPRSFCLFVVVLMLFCCSLFLQRRQGPGTQAIPPLPTSRLWCDVERDQPIWAKKVRLRGRTA